MVEFITAILLLVTGGFLAAVLRARFGPSGLVGQVGAISGSAIGFVSAVRVLFTGKTETMSGAWYMPGGGLHLQIDALSAFFLLVVFGLSILTALYGRSYLADRGTGYASAGSWLHLNMLTAGMALVIVAHDGLLFLLAWEMMALSPFFLVAFDDEKASVRKAAWIYLSATHLGTVFLLVFFVLFGQLAGTSDFDGYSAALKANPALSSTLFILALIGFGSKAGIVPTHVWLPEAHPAAPSHASALMSGAMIKVGIYGLIRALTFLGTPEPWWGWLLIAIGVSSGLLGVLFALAQHDLKRLLAYHSVENIGIILLGIGIGVLGLAEGILPLAVIGFAAGILHVLNHSVFKGLLFLAAGAVQHATHSVELEELGGLLRRMPWTGTAFLIGAAAIVGLPPLNGFVSEFLVFYSGFFAVVQPALSPAVAGMIVLVAMGLIGGLAAACFAKAFGIVFLGSPRSAAAGAAREVARPMCAAMAILALLCFVLGLAAPTVVAALDRVVAAATGLPMGGVREQLATVTAPLTFAVWLFAVFIVIAASIWAMRSRRLAFAAAPSVQVWGCGYTKPTARMQYTASSFAQPLIAQFRVFVRNREMMVPPEGYFPATASYSSESSDPFLRELFAPVFRWFDHLIHLEIFQHGLLHVYVLYLVVTLIALLIWGSI